MNSATGRLEDLNLQDPNGRRAENPPEEDYFARPFRQQQETIAQLLADQKRELFDKVDSSKRHNFRQKALEKQYEVNDNFAKIIRRSVSCLEKGHVSKTVSYLKDLKNDLEEHSQDIIAADFSRHGWLTVSRIRNRGSLPTSILKQIEKEDEQIDKRRKQPIFKVPKGTGKVDESSFRNPVRTNRFQPGQKKSPEQLLNEAIKQSRA